MTDQPTLAIVENDIRSHEVMAYEDQLSGAYAFGVIAGTNLVEKDELQSIPHIITAVTFQVIPEKVKKTDATPRGFVSIEATVASEKDLQRSVRRLRKSLKQPDLQIDDLAFGPDDRVVYNDGGTGVRRQIVEFLDMSGIITVGEPVLPEDITNKFDAPWTMWNTVPQMFEQKEGVSVPRITTFADGRPFKLWSRNGLRVSTYDGAYGEAATWYIG